MTVEGDLGPIDSSCPGLGVFPSGEEFREGWGEGAVGLYTASALLLVLNLGLYGVLVRRFIATVTPRQIPYLCWVTSLFPAIAFLTFLMLILPKATEFLLAVYQIYEALVIRRFVELNFLWYGGERGLLVILEHDSQVRFNTPPCCCCCLCLMKVRLTRNKLKLIKFALYQMVYILAFVVFMQLVFTFNGFHDGPLAGDNPHTYFKIIGKISFLVGLWGLFVIFQVKRTFNLLDGSMYTQKFLIMKITLFIFIFQETILEVLAKNGVLSCLPPIGPSGVGAVINSCLLMVETTLLGVASFMVYYLHPTPAAGEEGKKRKLNLSPAGGEAGQGEKDDVNQETGEQGNGQIVELQKL